MKTVTIDSQKCNKDGICVMACPTNVIQQGSADEVPCPSDDFKDYCIECGHCIAVCPTGAFSLNWLTPEQCPPIRKELALTEPQVGQFLRTRRSIRNYKDKPVEREKLEKLLEIACYAPSIGLGSCWGGYFYSAVNAYPKLFEALQLPSDHRAFGAVMVGYPKLKYQRLPLRNAPRVSWR